jgi:hypothetical protein
MKEINYNTNDCISLSSKINLMTNFGNIPSLIQFYKEQYSKQNCDKKIQDSAFKQLDNITEEYQKLDKERIETESFAQRNNKLILGVVILVSALLIVATISKNE